MINHQKCSQLIRHSYTNFFT